MPWVEDGFSPTFFFTSERSLGLISKDVVIYYFAEWNFHVIDVNIGHNNSPNCLFSKL